MSTRDVTVLVQYSSISLGIWHECKALAGSVSIKSLTMLKLKVSGWNPRDGVAKVGERRIQTSMGGNAEYVNCNPWSTITLVMVHTVTLERRYFFQLCPITGYCNSNNNIQGPGTPWKTGKQEKPSTAGKQTWKSHSTARGWYHPTSQHSWDGNSQFLNPRADPPAPLSRSWCNTQEKPLLVG